MKKIFQTHMYQSDGVAGLNDMKEGVSRILVVDGDPSRCAQVAEMLAPGPFEIVAAFSGAEAMETIAEEPPDVIVTNLLVAGMSALDLVHLLRASPATEKTPVIVMSGLDQREDLARVLEDEATDFIATPLQTMELRSRVRSTALMQRCLVNLMVNALKFAPRGTTVAVSMESFEDRAEIAVTDEGPGISDHHRHEIFDRFAVRAAWPERRGIGRTGTELLQACGRCT